MAAPTLGTFLRRLGQAMAAEALADCPDRDLVERIRTGRDEAALRAILERHGLMVFRVCRRVLACPADVEDAFQATFLVLVRRGHTIRRRASLAAWLHGVAHRTALKLRTQADRRRRRETRAARGPNACIPDDTPWGEVRAVLDEELGRLPAANRAALVLCCLEGRTQEEAAAQLGLSKRTVQRHLVRGRDLLGRRLARRGLALGAALGARLVSDCTAGAGVPRTLIGRTVASASHAAAGRAAPAGVVSPRVAALSDGVTRAMCFAKYQTAAVLLACGLALGFGVRQFGPPPAAAQDPAPRAARPAAPDIEPIDPNLVFDPAVQKQLRLSPNQVRQLTDARDKGAATVADQGKRVAEIDRRIQELQAEINRLDQERRTAQQAIDKAQGDGVKAAIPNVLSKDAVGQLRQLTIQRMRLSEVLLDARVRGRLDLNDEQVKKIQEINEKNNTFLFQYLTLGQPVTFATDQATVRLGTEYLSNESRAELLKVLTAKQREALEKLSGMTFDKK
jgi:RNA polymerase sigma factor (sigma-70 family)